MSGKQSDVRTDAPDSRPAEDTRLARLAAFLGLELPIFQGPLDAFQAGGDRAPQDPVYLGGDLHAVHPETADRPPPQPRDHTLDGAKIVLDDQENDRVEAIAVEGVWCVALRGAHIESAPTFMLWDTDGQLRSCLFLPPARLMIGLGHYRLPAIRSRPGRVAGRAQNDSRSA